MIRIEPIKNQITQQGFLDAVKVDITLLSGKLGSPMSFYYRVLAEKLVNESIVDVLVLEGNTTMTEKDYEDWDSTDDKYAEDFVLNTLNLKRA